MRPKPMSADEVAVARIGGMLILSFKTISPHFYVEGNAEIKGVEAHAGLRNVSNQINGCFLATDSFQQIG